MLQAAVKPESDDIVVYPRLPGLTRNHTPVLTTTCDDVSDEDCYGRSCRACPAYWDSAEAPDLDLECDDVSEVRVTDSVTGGQKGRKLARYDLIPVTPLRLLAEHYGKGAQKYEERNWERGYQWSLSYAAAQRHINAFWGGQELDPDPGPTQGRPHLVAAVWHLLALQEFCETHRAGDDRPLPNAEQIYPKAKPRLRLVN